MNGAQDMGGVMGFGPVVPERDEPVFHAEWERRVLGMYIALAMPIGWTIDQMRFAREDVPPVEYLSKTYYEIWFAGLTRYLLERGYVAKDELDAGRALHAPKPVGRVLPADEAAAMLAKGSIYERPETALAHFAIGERVRTRNMHPTGHTRLPRYVRGHSGIVTHIHGVHAFPDASATGDRDAGQWLYTVRFSGPELWGDAADPTVTVSVDAWESYLEPSA